MATGLASISQSSPPPSQTQSATPPPPAISNPAIPRALTSSPAMPPTNSNISMFANRPHRGMSRAHSFKEQLDLTHDDGDMEKASEVARHTNKVIHQTPSFRGNSRPDSRIKPEPLSRPFMRNIPAWSSSRQRPLSRPRPHINLS